MGRSIEQNRRVKDQRRQEILDSALSLFASRGPAATRISDIAEAVGISSGLVYHYFSAKDDIVFVLAEEAFANLDAAAAELESLSIAACDKLRLAVGGLLKSLEESDRTARTHLFIAQLSVSEATPEAVRVLLDRERGRSYETIERIIRDGQAACTVRPGDAAAMSQLFWSTVQGLAIHKAVHGDCYRSPAPTAVLRMFLEDEA